MTAHVLVIGSLNIDMEIDVEHFPLPGETILSQSFSTSFGGKGANQAIAAARLGGETSIIGAVGQDEYGQSMLENLTQNAIDTTYVKTIPKTPSGRAIITRSQGQNSITVVSGANSSLTAEDVEKAIPLIQKADTLLLQYELPLSVITRTIEFGHYYNKTIIVNPAPLMLLPEEIQKKVSFFIPNEHEITAFATHDTQAIEDIILSSPRRIIMTYGKKGVLYSPKPGKITLIPAKTVDVVDTTGAGDCFCCAFSVFFQEFPLKKAIELAVQASSLAITKAGAQAALPYRHQLSIE